MAASIPTVGDLRRKAEVFDDEIEAAADAYLADPKADAFRFRSGHVLDLAEAVATHPQAKAALADETTPPAFRRTMARTAVILGFPKAG